MNTSNKSKKLIELSLTRMRNSYQLCSDDRKRLHSIEWESDPDSGSVLGEVEVCVDALSGIAIKLLKHNLKNLTTETLNIAEKKSLLASPTVIHWLTESGENFPQFVDLIQSVEFLRLTLIGSHKPPT